MLACERGVRNVGQRAFSACHPPLPTPVPFEELRYCSSRRFTAGLLQAYTISTALHSSTCLFYCAVTAQPLGERPLNSTLVSCHSRPPGSLQPLEEERLSTEACGATLTWASSR